MSILEFEVCIYPNISGESINALNLANITLEVSKSKKSIQNR